MIIYFFFYLISISIIGYGLISEKILKIKFENLGVTGIIGISSVALISYSSSIFFKHDYLFNLIFLSLGIVFFIFGLKNIINKKKEFLIFFLVFSVLLIFISIGKNHDDFPYYHFPYSIFLTEFSHPLGLGNLNNGFRSPSSIFFINSMFYFPKIKYYLFHITPALILGFSNLILLKIIFDKKINQKVHVINILGLILLIFLNIFFYRLAEHGTDRSGMILVMISILYILFILNNLNLKSYDENFNVFKFIVITLCFVASLKPFYIINFSLVLIFLINSYQRKILINFLFSRAFYFCFLIIFFTIFYNFINSGCLIFPASFTCFENFSWSISREDVSNIKIWFELWSKAGASPNYVVTDRAEYIDGFNWIPNWMDNYFFNKVSDFIIGIIFLTVVVTASLISKKLVKKSNKINFISLFLILILLLVEWFLNHPTLRYGGYHLIAIILFIPISIYLSKFDLEYSNFIKKASILILVTGIIFFSRNIIRVNQELKQYGYNPFSSPNYKFIGDYNHYFRYNNYMNENSANHSKLKIFGIEIIKITSKK